MVLSAALNSAAYVVVSPDVERNQNRYRLYVRDLEVTTTRDNGRLLLETSAPLRYLQWPKYSQKLFVLEQADPHQSIKQIDSITAESKVVTSGDAITSFSVDAKGSMVVFSLTNRPQKPSAPDYADFGYPILLGKGLTPAPETTNIHDLPAKILVARRGPTQGFDVSSISDSLNNLRDVRALALSPDGRRMTLSYKAVQFPVTWQSNSYVRWLLSEGTIPDTLGLYDFDTGKLDLAFDAPSAGWGHPAVWAEDSRAFSVNALSPVGSHWEKQELAERPLQEGENWPYIHSHTFAVDLSGATVSEVVKQPASWFMNQTVSWKKVDGPLLLRTDDRTYEWRIAANPDWRKRSASALHLGPVNIYSAMYVDTARLNAASDGERIVGVFENTTSPPEIFFHEISLGRTSILTDLNPELRSIILQPVETFRWHDRHRFHCTGRLVLPYGYVPGKRYPLVIMTKTWWLNYFLTDTEYHTAFAPQPLAAAGFLVLLTPERPVEFEDDLDRRYSRASAILSESEELKDIIDSAVDELSRLGMVDRANVGLAGFSTTSWKTDVLLTHWGTRFLAASSADSGLWNYGLYWSSNSAELMHDSEKYVGGPPYGKSFQRWIKQSPAFNAFRIKAPLLMEYIASGREGIDGLEFFVALRKQNRPADLFFYPRGDHVLENPRERIASLQRNVDWFRFWMQDREGQPPRYDPDQYARWHVLKHQVLAQSGASDRR